MSHAKITHITVIMVAVLLIVGVALPVGTSHAQGKVKGEWILPKHYPDGFDNMGHINSITKDGIVIDDHSFGFSPSVRFSTPTRERASRSRFRAADLVGYIVNEREQIEGLYLLKK
jgi:hypothetical protein